MKKIAFILPVFALLAACGETGEDAEIDIATAPTAIEPLEDTLPPPQRDTFAATFAESCPDAEPVNKATCLAQGMGSDSFNCEYGLGDDEYLRHDAVISQADGKYVLDNPDTVCAQ